MILGIGFMKIDSQLTIKLLIVFNFTPIFNQIKSLKFSAFFKKIFSY